MADPSDRPTSLGSALNQALKDRHFGTVEVTLPQGRARAEILDSGPIGARVRQLEVEVPDPAPPQTQAHRLSGRLPGLEEDLVPVEVDPGLGGGVLRTAPEQLGGGRYHELELRGGRARLHRPSRERDQAAGELVLTRDALERLVDTLARGLDAGGDGAI